MFFWGSGGEAPRIFLKIFTLIFSFSGGFLMVFGGSGGRSPPENFDEFRDIFACFFGFLTNLTQRGGCMEKIF